jgi:hypothetical protein
VNDELQEKWTGRVIVCIDLNASYSSCEELRDQSLKGKSHAVIMTDQDKEKLQKELSLPVRMRPGIMVLNLQ